MLLEKLYSTLILAAMFATGAMAQSESALITKPAEGTTVTFPPTSYIGIDTTTACYMYASSAVMGKGVDDDRSTNIFDTYRYALINAWTSARLHRCRRSSPPSSRMTLTRGEAPAACSSR